MPEATEPHHAGRAANHAGRAANHALGSEDAVGNMAASEANKNNATAESSKLATPMKARKRTKTGCLSKFSSVVDLCSPRIKRSCIAACRKRRIKCGEERPTCKNCVKSKRECEGYIPRVIFKDPLGAFRPTQQGLAARTQHPSHAHGNASAYGSMPPASVDTPIAPRLLPYGERSGIEHMPVIAGPGGAGNFHGHTAYTHGLPSYSGGDGAPQSLVSQMGYSSSGFPNHSVSGNFTQSHVDSYPYQAYHQRPTRHNDGGGNTAPPQVPNGWSHGSDLILSTGVPAPHVEYSVLNPEGFHIDRTHQNGDWLVREESASNRTQHNVSSSSFPAPDQSEWNGAAVQDVSGHQADLQNQQYVVPTQTPWVMEPEDDEYYDVESDEEGLIPKATVTGTNSYNLGAMVAITADQGQGRIRSMTNFLNEPNILATYFPSWAASPLRDAQTARVFCHFITATAPTLSVCERHPSNPALIFSGKPVPWSQRALWSYILPMRALTHQGLLHAMLALASLHIAKLQQTSSTPSLKHYHYALRRVGKALGNQKKRRDVATLAATQLLGFYEVTTAEHNKWNSHLAGARELIMDIDFARMVKRIEAHRQQQEQAEARLKHEMQLGITNAYWHEYAQGVLDDFPSKVDRQLNETLISTIMGWASRYDQHGRITDESDPAPQTEAPLTPLDIENFEIQCELFWWYAKHDIYQSIISGNRLL